MYGGLGFNATSLGLLAVGLFTLFILNSIRVALAPGIRSLPGPFLARFTPWYRFWQITHGDAPHWYLRLHEKYGPIVRTGPNTVDLSDPQTIPVVYGVNSKFTKSAFYDTMEPFFEDRVMPSMFSSKDPAVHSALRRPVMQKFSMSSIKQMEPLADECTQIFISAMKDLEGTAVDLGVWAQWYAFDVIGAITFQRRFGFMAERKDIEGMIGGIEMGLMYAGTIGQVPALHKYLIGNLYLMKFLAWQTLFHIADPSRTIVRYTQECIDEYDRNPTAQPDRPDFLAWLRGEEKKGKPMSHRDLINHLSNNLLAGSDTTAISLRAVFYYVVQNPAVYRKLQREIDDADRAGKLSEFVTYPECLELEYLQAVMKEAMRCHPGVSFPLERVVPEGGAEFGNVHLNQGVIVGVNPAVIHHDKSIFGDDAAIFRPERWLDSSPEQVKLMDRNNLTFGYGSRTCIGKNISIMEMGKLVPQIMRHFELEWASPDPHWTVKHFWFARQHGLIVRFKSRKA